MRVVRTVGRGGKETQRMLLEQAPAIIQEVPAKAKQSAHAAVAHKRGEIFKRRFGDSKEGKRCESQRRENCQIQQEAAMEEDAYENRGDTSDRRAARSRSRR